jgi:hypothetical protein
MLKTKQDISFYQTYILSELMEKDTEFVQLV